MYLESMIKTECVGCGACVDCCPKGCVTLVEDIEHFLYPTIERERCINCGMCRNVCPVDKAVFNDSGNSKVVVGRSRCENILYDSSSGGCFTSLYRALLKRNYYIYGVRWGENFKVLHDCAKTEKECEQFRKSKYVLSDTNHVYSAIEKRLKSSENVCFVGTPCQCAALQTFLKIKGVSTEKLYLIDIICHGAPNQAIFSKYITEKIRVVGRISKYTFKNKSPVDGIVNTRTVEIINEDGKRVIFSADNDPFLRGYYGRLFYRPACGECHYARPDRVSDITIGDAWHVEEEIKEWNSLEGVSLILLNTEKGKMLFPELEETMDVRESSIEWAVKTNSQLREPTNMHWGRNSFFELFDNCTFEVAVELSMRDSLPKKFLRKIKRVMCGKVR